VPGPALEVVAAVFSGASCTSNGSRVSRGGDTDTNGAVAGALLGARHGKGRIPERWLKPLKAASELASLGEQLYRQL